MQLLSRLYLLHLFHSAHRYAAFDGRLRFAALADLAFQHASVQGFGRLVFAGEQPLHAFAAGWALRRLREPSASLPRALQRRLRIRRTGGSRGLRFILRRLPVAARLLPAAFQELGCTRRRGEWVMDRHGVTPLRFAYFRLNDIRERNLDDDIAAAVAALDQRGRPGDLGQDSFARLLSAFL